MSKEILESLKAPFHPDEVKARKAFGGNKKVLHYIDARNVMERLDDVIGATNWQSEVISDGAKTICKLSLRLDGEWISKSDGAGDTQIEADKGAISDAFKRAAVLFGVGRYLYEGRDPTEVYNEYHNIKGGNQKVSKVNVLSELKKCKTRADIDNWKLKHGSSIQNLDNAEEIKQKYIELKNKFKGE